MIAHLLVKSMQLDGELHLLTRLVVCMCRILLSEWSAIYDSTVSSSSSSTFFVLLLPCMQNFPHATQQTHLLCIC